MEQKFYFTSESVSEGHPDKVADQISDAIVDYFISHDSQARVAVEVLVTTNKIVLAGEVKTNFDFLLEELNKIARNTVKKIGYEQKGFDYRSLHIDNYIHTQSKDIAIGVDATEDKEEGAGDQGIMFGYACNETTHLMPATIHYAHKILHEISRQRLNHKIKGLLPDSKSQVTILYKNGVPEKITTIVVSHQHEESLTGSDVKKIILPILKAVLPQELYNQDACEHHINPTGRFVIGGPDGDTGITGRKIIVDTYGGVAPHGGGAFSGKDPSKVDRSAAYAARYIAKNIVAAGIASKCIIQLAYAIGVSKPLSIYVNTRGTAQVEDETLAEMIKQLIDLSPKGIRTKLNLNKPIYYPTASYGHFGRESVGDLFPWERIDMITAFKDYLIKHAK